MNEDYTFTAHYSRWRRRWVGRCTCGATLKPLFHDPDSSLPEFFMKIHLQATHDVVE